MLLLGAFEATAAAGFGLAEETRVSAIGGAAAVVANPHGTGSASEHALDGELGPVAELMAIFLEKAFPAFIVLEQKFCGRGMYMRHSIKCGDEGERTSAAQQTSSRCRRTTVSSIHNI
jgi:hypothetical protein